MVSLVGCGTQHLFRGLGQPVRLNTSRVYHHPNLIALIGLENRWTSPKLRFLVMPGIGQSSKSSRMTCHKRHKPPMQEDLKAIECKLLIYRIGLCLNFGYRFWNSDYMVRGIISERYKLSQLSVLFRSTALIRRSQL